MSMFWVGLVLFLALAITPEVVALVLNARERDAAGRGDEG